MSLAFVTIQSYGTYRPGVYHILHLPFHSVLVTPRTSWFTLLAIEPCAYSHLSSWSIVQKQHQYMS